MTDGPYIRRTTDHGGEHRASVKGGNHEPLMAITEGIVDQRDVETALLRSLEALLTDDKIDAESRAQLVLDYLERHGANASRAGETDLSPAELAAGAA